ncbi:hypothetical protein MCAMS1_00311 [biofilm metagenome]
MLRLVFEAVMVIAVVSCLYFMMKLGEMDNKPDDSSSDEGDDIK